jgi:flagellar motor protein MotB
MRNLIISISILFFVLSGIIAFKALGIPDRNTTYNYDNVRDESKSKGFQAQSRDISEQIAREQAANRALVEKLQSTIARLEDKLSNKQKESTANVEELQSTIARLEDKLSNRHEESKVNAEAGAPERTSRVLAVLGSGTFSPGQAVINESLMKVVKESVQEILASPENRVRIEGHTDNVPIRLVAGKKYTNNMDLSFLRAKALAGILVEHGVPLENISVIGYGETHPIASNATVEGRAKNRRVEIKLISGNKEF